MDRTRRLGRLEDGLDPRAAFLVWLSEAQQYPSVIDYARAHVENADPFGDVLKRAIEGAHRGCADDRTRKSYGSRGASGASCSSPITSSSGSTSRPSDASSWSACASRCSRGGCANCRTGGSSLSTAAKLRGLPQPTASRATGRHGARRSDLRAELEATDAARRDIEARYLSGHESLFPAPAAALAEHRRRLEGLAALAASEGHAAERPVVPPEHVETITDGYVRLASANARLALDEDEAADAVIGPLLMAT